jgi:hypothetical protein
MGWPFSNVVAPNLDTGPGVTVPTSPTAITASAAWLLGASFTNTGTVQRTVTITDSAGVVVVEIIIAGGADVDREWTFRPVTGLKWFVDAGTDVIGQAWGYV